MERVFIVRKVVLGALALSALLFLAMALADHDGLQWFVLTAHLSMVTFVATESFGPVAHTRSAFGRGLARVFLGMYALAGIGALALLIMGPFG